MKMGFGVNAYFWKSKNYMMGILKIKNELLQMLAKTDDEKILSELLIYF